MAETPQGYDRTCDQCHQPYTFDNARAVRTLNWRRFCCPGCERGETWARARRIPAGVALPLAPERVEIGSVVLPGITGEEHDPPEFVERSGVLELLQERLVRSSKDHHLSVFVEVAAGVMEDQRG